MMNKKDRALLSKILEKSKKRMERAERLEKEWEEKKLKQRDAKTYLNEEIKIFHKLEFEHDTYWRTAFENEKEKEAKRKYWKKQNKSSYSRIRSSLGKRVKQLIGSKQEKYQELIGCSPKHLIQHLESKFMPGMSWDNYGKWHIDHVIPCCAFDLSVKEERLKCFHYTNLQPLWAKDNIAKSDKLPSGERARKANRPVIKTETTPEKDPFLEYFARQAALTSMK